MNSQFRQDHCLELLDSSFMTQFQTNESNIRALMDALSFTVNTPLERIINAAKEEIAYLITSTEAEVLRLPKDPIFLRWAETACRILNSQPFLFPREELEKFCTYLITLHGESSLQKILCTAIDKHIAFEKRLGWLTNPMTYDEIQKLDPKENCDEIYHFLSYEFRSEMKVFSILYELRAIVAANTNSFFLATREFSERSVKRIVDTVILFANPLEWGLDSYRGKVCIQKINEIHGRYYIPNDAFKFVLAGIMFIPEDWNSRFGWRPFTQIEKLGWFHSLVKVGRAMNIQEVTDSYEDMKSWYLDLCQRYAQPSVHKRKLFDQVVGQLLACYPEQIRPLLLTAILAGMDDVYRIATGYPTPPQEVCNATKSVFFTIGHLGSTLPRIPWFRTLQSNAVYPLGYKLEELGVNRRSPYLPEILRFTESSNDFSIHHNGGYPAGMLPIQKNDEQSALAFSSTSSFPVFTIEQVAEHRSEKDIWVVIHGEVYDLSTFGEVHPGGLKVLLKHAGKDATEAFDLVKHSDLAKTLMLNFRIGRIHSGTEILSSNPAKCPFAALLTS